MRKIALLACVAAVASSAAWAADVTVAGLNAPNGALAVDADTTVLTNGFNATLPSALAAEATLWFAADTNVIADENGGVTEWRDVREAANAETRLYKAALAYLPEEGEDGYEYRSELPVLTTTNVLPRASAKVVDFGSYGNGRWLYFAAPGSTDRLRVNIGSFFTVIGFDSTCGHILGDVGQLGAGGAASTYGVMFFHKGLGSGTGGNISTTDEGNSVMHLGETRLDGARVDPRTTKYNYNAFQLFSQNGPDRTTRGTPYACLHVLQQQELQGIERRLAGAAGRRQDRRVHRVRPRALRRGAARGGGVPRGQVLRRARGGARRGGGWRDACDGR